ncbi:MAG: hypothetical protein PWP61_1186 [Trichococcus sp.]|jgi:energy coupling factor transporter S component ThiW|nr:hypothetical protein [Trichococcus sp.]
MNTKKLVTTALIIAMGVVSNSLFVIPIGLAKVAPMQHLLNVLTAVWLGPGYAVLQAFGVSVLRNLLGTGTIFAFPGSMIGAVCAGLFYARTQKIGYAALGEWAGTGILGSLVSTLLAQFIIGKTAALMLFLPSFAISAAVGAGLAYVILREMEKRNVLVRNRT